MDRSLSDQPAHDGQPAPDQSGGVVRAVPSLSGAHWANRDSDTLYRRSGRSGTLRRPPASGVPAAPVSPPAESPSGFPVTDGVANADLFGPDPQRLQSDGTDGPRSTVERRARLWTAIGTWTRRPKTGDRPKATAPAGGTPSVTTIGSLAAVPEAGRLEAAAQPPAERDMIGDIGTGGHEIRAHRAERLSGGGRGGRGSAGSFGTGRNVEPAGPPRRSRKVLWATVVTVLIVLAGGVGAVLAFPDRAGALRSVLWAGAGSTADRTITAPLDGRTEASFELVTGVTKMTLTSGDIGDDLYRVTTAEDSGTVPRAVVDDDRVQLHLTAEGSGAGGGVQIVLASKVTWALRLTGGADEQRIDLSRGRVGGVDVVGGARRVELTLPKPTGTVGVRITGAVDEFAIIAPAENPVRLQLASGAKTVTAGAKTQRNVPPGSTFTPRNFDVEDRYDVDAASRVTLFSVGVPG